MWNNGELAKVLCMSTVWSICWGLFVAGLLCAVYVSIDLFCCCCCCCCGCSFYLVRSEPSGKMEQLIGFDNVAGSTQQSISFIIYILSAHSPYKWIAFSVSVAVLWGTFSFMSMCVRVCGAHFHSTLFHFLICLLISFLPSFDALKTM